MVDDDTAATAWTKLDEGDETDDDSDDDNNSPQLDDGLKTWEPTHGPHQVFFSIHFDMLYDISDVDQRFKVKLSITLEWMLSTSEKASYTADRAAWKPEWQPPPPRFLHALSQDVQAGGAATVEKWSNMLSAKMVYHCSLELSECFELRSFPFDVQDFTVAFRIDEPNTICQLKPTLKKEAFVELPRSALGLSKWRIHDPICEIRLLPEAFLDEQFVPSERHITSVSICIKGERLSASYILRIAMIMAIIAASSVYAFFIWDGGVSAQLAHGATCMLTAVPQKGSNPRPHLVSFSLAPPSLSLCCC